jgi:hypothetical protein
MFALPDVRKPRSHRGVQRRDIVWIVTTNCSDKCDPDHNEAFFELKIIECSAKKCGSPRKSFIRVSTRSLRGRLT